MMRRITVGQETAIIAAVGITYWFGWCSLVSRWMIYSLSLAHAGSLRELWAWIFGIAIGTMTFLYLGQFPWRVAVHLYRRYLQPRVLRKEDEDDGRDVCSGF